MSASKSKRKDKDDTTNPDVTLPGIGNYIFQKTVGEGNFAKVKLSTHKITGAEVAIKVIDKTTLDEKKVSKLYREVRIMKMLHHPNIIKLYEVIETKYTVFLVMEYASGGELYDYLVVHGKMKEKDARAKFRQILSAVNYCHKKKVIHRDLKAENLLLDHNLDIKIADFGFSNQFDPDSKLDTFCGSPPYAAPELFQGRRYTGPEVDIWSLGVILYVLTTGCLPFDGKNLQEMRESVCRGKYRIPFFLTDNCEKLLRKFLVRDPLKRNTLDLLIDDPWINDGFSTSPITTDESETVLEDESVIKLMEVKYKLDKQTILTALRDNVYNDISAIYFLLYYDRDAKASLERDPGSSDVQKIMNPAKKESTPVAPVMPIIGEDEVLPERASDAIPEENHARSASTQPPAAVVGGGRRKRAATVNAGAVIPEADDSKPAAENTDKPVIEAFPTNKSTVESTTTAASTQPGERKRHNTITGMIRGLTAKKDEKEEEGDTDKPRSLRFTFNSNTTSTKPPDEIVVELIKACNKMGLTHRLITRYLLECASTTSSPGKEVLKVEVEVCKLPRLNNLHGLKFKRISGSSSDYKEVSEQLLAAVQL